MEKTKRGVDLMDEEGGLKKIRAAGAKEVRVRDPAEDSLPLESNFRLSVVPLAGLRNGVCAPYWHDWYQRFGNAMAPGGIIRAFLSML
ncbi:MAG: hypothetical protein JWR26_2364 [Pedosphaera sp.]|nr:hypothetical protein [Pedosphaera sp.]